MHAILIENNMLVASPGAFRPITGSSMFEGFFIESCVNMAHFGQRRLHFLCGEKQSHDALLQDLWEGK